MTVFVLFARDAWYRTEECYGVFSTREKAMKFAKELQRRDKRLLKYLNFFTREAVIDPYLHIDE